MKLTINKGKNGIIGYSIFINKSEAEASGFIDANGNSVELIKEVDSKNGAITVKKNTEGVARVAVSSKFLRANLERLKTGENIKTARNDHYVLKGDVLYKQKHQSYLRGEEPSPYAEFVGAVFYGIVPEEAE